jgi:hypothetical protein
MSKNVELEGPKMKTEYGACALQAGYVRLHARMEAPAHTRAYIHKEICTIYCYSTATMVTRRRLGVTLFVLSLFLLLF